MSEPSNQGFTAASQGTLVNNVTGTPEVQRTPTIWKCQIGATGSTTVWTPAAGKKYRLMGWYITISKEAACAGAFQIALQDSAGTWLFRSEISNAALVATGQVEEFSMQLNGNGYISPTANNTLTFYATGSLTAGVCTATVWGTEE